MPEYLAPGVYIEETSFRSKSIEGVSTTTTGFVGPCRYGPIDLQSELVTSLSDFVQTYGDGAQLELSDLGKVHNYLWHAARAFFIEGGKRLYVARIYRRTDGKKNGFEANTGDGTPAADGSYPDGYARASRIPSGAATADSILFRARYPGAYGNFHVRLTMRLGQNLLRSDGTVSGLLPRDVVAARKLASAPIDHEGFYVAERTNAGAWELRGTGGTTLALSDFAGHELRVVTADLSIDEIPGARWEGLSLDPEHRRNGAGDSLSALLGFDAQDPELSRGVPIVFAPGGSLTDGLAILGALFDATARAALMDPKSSDDARTLKVNLAGGTDGVRPGSAEYEGAVDESTMRKTGLRQLEDLEDISIVAAPGSTFGYEGDPDEGLATVGAVINHAERMRYRIAVLDSGDGQSIGKVREMRAKIDSKYAALYYPWVRVQDPITRQPIVLPPSGFVAGIYARNDTERAVYKAPANEVVSLAIGFEVMLNKAQQDVLNPEGINAFRFFEGRGYRLWGARTVSSDPEWKYVNLRRYFAYLERSIDKGTQWAVFEPNGPQLWANVRRTIEDFLLNEWQSGALLGDKPEKSFFVRCDRSTMTQNDLDNGRLICLIGVAPLRPAEFVIFRIGQWTADRKV